MLLSFSSIKRSVREKSWKEFNRVSNPSMLSVRSLYIYSVSTFFTVFQMWLIRGNESLLMLSMYNFKWFTKILPVTAHPFIFFSFKCRKILVRNFATDAENYGRSFSFGTD